MKLRQKLAAVMAASMIVTAVPVVTMAATYTKINTEKNVRDGSTLGYGTSKIILNEGTEEQTTVSAISLNDGATSKNCFSYLSITPQSDCTDSSFFIELTDATFNYAAYLAASLNDSTFGSMSDFNTGAISVYEKGGIAYSYTAGATTGVSLGKSAKDLVKNEVILTYEVPTRAATSPYAEFTIIDDTTMRVDVYGSWQAATKTTDGTKLIVPLLVEADSTQVKVKIDADDSSFASEEVGIGVTNEDGKELTITADDAKTAIPVDGGEISKLVITEEILGAITDSENRQIKLELPSSADLEWKLTDIKATGKRGFAGLTDEDVEAEYGTSGRYNNTDKQVLIITLPNWTDNSARGVIELEGLTVRPTEKTAKTGELSIQVSAVDDKDLVKEKSLVVGVVTEYGVALTCEKPATVKAGRSAIVNKYSIEATLSENVKDSMVTGRDIKFTLENGYIIGAADIITDSDAEEFSPKSSAYKEEALKVVQQLVKDEKIKFSKDGKHAKITDVEVNKDGQVIGFTVDGDSIANQSKKEEERFSDDEKDLLKVKMPVAASLSATGEVKLTVSGRAFAQLGQEESISCKIADIVAPVKVEMTAAELKVGLQSQTTGSIVITETDKGMIERGTIIVDANPQEVAGIKFQSVPKVEATNLKVSDVELSANKKYLYIEVEKTSTEAGSISISDIAFTTDRTVPEGTFPVRFYGDALTDEAIKTYDEVLFDKYVVEDFIKITTPNTEDIKNGALKAVTSSFTLDSTKYTVDGVEYEMDAKAYAEDGRTMVPVRYVAQAFGIDASNVLYANQVATIIAGEKIIQVQMGSNILTVNGAQIQMDTKAVVKDGRAYVPMKFIAAALGVNVSYDDATKTATFSNKN